MFTLDESPGRTVRVDNKEYLFFSGYSYLGMNHINDFLDLVKEGMDKYGLLYPSSRISNTRLQIFEEVEAMLSILTSSEETVIYSSGFLAGRAIAELLVEEKAQCFIAPTAHAAIQLPGTRLHNNWQEHFLELVETEPNGNFFLITDSVDPLNATVTDFSFLKKASLAKRICCIIDDSHGIGLLGERGEGISLSLPQLDRVNWMLSYSLSKAFNINGGAISCSKKTATLLRRSPFYTASTSISPALCYAFKNGQSIYQQKREQLKRSIVTLQLLLKNKQVRFHPELPIFVLPQKFDQDYFYRHNIIISSFPYPDPAGEKINRLIVNALHTTTDLKVVAEILNAEASEVLL